MPINTEEMIALSQLIGNNGTAMQHLQPASRGNSEAESLQSSGIQPLAEVEAVDLICRDQRISQVIAWDCTFSSHGSADYYKAQTPGVL